MCMQEGTMQKDWRMGLIVPIWKSTGDVHDTGDYRGITLLSQVLQLLKRGLDARIRRRQYFDPCYARATVARARFLAAAFSDGSYLAHVNGAYLRHVTFCIVRGPPLFIVSPISQRGPLPRLVQSPRRRTPASPILV